MYSLFFFFKKESDSLSPKGRGALNDLLMDKNVKDRDNGPSGAKAPYLWWFPVMLIWPLVNR
jgi:hypothetical protein